jgi:hypothetical protein
MPLGASFPVVPTNPSRDDALKALTLLRSLLAEFPFADGQRGASEAVMLSAIISAIMRPALGNVPLHAFNAPASRTGIEKLHDAELSFSIFDPLNIAGSVVLNLNPNAFDFLKTGGIVVQGQP